MRLKDCFKLREVAGEYMLVPSGSGAVDFNAVFSLSESAAWLWKSLQGVNFDEETARTLIEGEYDVDGAAASKDVRALLEQWKINGMVDE